MYKKILELLILSVLFLSPLLHVSIEDFTTTRTMWSGSLLTSLAIIIFFLKYPFRVQNIFKYLFAPVGSIAISSFVLATYPAHALAIYLAVLVLLLLFIFKNVLENNPKNKTIFVATILCCLGLYAQWGIAQFIVQHDLGMRRIGESVLNQNIPGIASFYGTSGKVIRAYGPFGHSNSFGGVLLCGILLLHKYKSKLQSTIFFQGLLFVIVLGSIVSFSRTALVGLVIVSLVSAYKRKWLISFPIGIAGLLFIPLFFLRSLDTHGAAIQERIIGLQWFIDMMNPQTLLQGFGIGNYTTALSDHIANNSITHNPWDIAPVHSVPLVLIAELGCMIAVPFFVILIRFISIKKTWILLALLPALIFDHYFATQLSPLLFLITTAHLVV